MPMELFGSVVGSYFRAVLDLFDLLDPQEVKVADHLLMATWTVNASTDLRSYGEMRKT